MTTAHKKMKQSDAPIAHAQSMPLRIPMTSTILYTIGGNVDKGVVLLPDDLSQPCEAETDALEMPQ